MDQLGYEMIGNFSDFAELFLSGGLQYGSYWTMLKVFCHIFVIGTLDRHGSWISYSNQCCELIK